MKALKFLVMFFVLFYPNLFSQQWVEKGSFGSSIWGIYVVNADVIYVLSGGAPDKFWKSTDKGQSWNMLHDFGNTNQAGGAAMSFINSNTGWINYGENAGQYQHKIFKTTDGGSSWNLIVTDPNLADYPRMKFIKDAIGFMWHPTNGYLLRNLYKTSNNGYSWNIVWTSEGGAINDVEKSVTDPNNNTVYVCANRNNNPYLLKSTDAFISNPMILADGNSDPWNLGVIGSMSDVSENGQDILKLACSYGMGEVYYNVITNIGTNPIGIYQIGFQFYDANNGIINNSGQIFFTSNRGVTWNNEANGGIGFPSMIGQKAVLAYGSSVRIRYLNTNLNTNYDWQGGYPGQMTVDGITYNTPSNQFINAGTTSLSENHLYDINGTDTTAQFYYWGGICNNSMNSINNSVYFTYQGLDINADYKSSLKSTIPEALKDANQVKTLKDTNGVTNLIYESMGGIFFTRTRPDGHYKLEEVVSGTYDYYATFNNTNPYISEIKYPYNYNPTSQQKEENVLACWERREGNNIKICSKSRTQIGPSPYFQWGVNENEVIYTITGAPEGFKCYPKIFYLYNGAHKYKILTFLKPDGTNKKLVGKVIKDNSTSYPEIDIVSSKNIQEYAIASIPQFGQIAIFNQYIAYRVNLPLKQAIYFKRIHIGYDELQNNVKYEVVNDESDVSIDDSRYRASLDIALRNTSTVPNTFNMQPVITYQGQRNIIVKTRDVWGNPQELGAVYYPIFVRERLENGIWNSYIFKYEQLNVVQQTPMIEGSKQKNSFLLNYTQNLTTHRQIVPRWNGGSPNTWYCSPNTFTGTDARLIKGSLINESSINHKLMTLTHPDATYLIGSQPFSITDNPIEQGVEAVNGVVINDNIKYSFNLGDIMVNWNTINFYNELDTAIEDGSEFNENFTSKTFYLNDYDTLVIGRNAFYVVDDPGEFHQYEYWVKLMNKSSGEMQTLLANDTIQVGDTIQVEYLEGFIIDNIPVGSDSFYVQMEVDTLEADGGYGIGGGDGGDGGGDNINTIKRNVFWVGENIKIKNNTLPTVFNLYQNFPNPFNPVTKIKYDLPKNVNVTIKIYDLLGREVTTLINNEYKNAGRYELDWNAQNYASGVYIYRIEAGDYVKTKKMILLK